MGRAAELAELKRRLELAEEGHGRPVLLVGPAGIGKTAPIRRCLAAWAERTDAMLACGYPGGSQSLRLFARPACATGGRGNRAGAGVRRNGSTDRGSTPRAGTEAGSATAVCKHLQPPAVGVGSACRQLGARGSSQP